MNFSEDCLYHVYNRTFQSTRAFRSDRNYRYFLGKLATLTSFCAILAYCLMPDHFHLLINIPKGSVGLAPLSGLKESPRMQVICRKIGTILSSYTQGFNKQERRIGSLFQPRTKSKQLDLDHAYNCFHYIHQNPVKAHLVSRMEDWQYSSIHEYLGVQPKICDTATAAELFNLPSEASQFLRLCNEETGKNISLETFEV
jgi:putative transposase